MFVYNIRSNKFNNNCKWETIKQLLQNQQLSIIFKISLEKKKLELLYRFQWSILLIFFNYI